MKNVLVLGCGRGQIPIMNLCHQYGCNVIGVTPKGDYPGTKIADLLIFANVRDYDDILYKIKDIRIDAVVTDQLDIGVLSAATLAEKLSIKGISSIVAERFTNKFVMRKYAEKLGVDVPYSICVNNLKTAIETISCDSNLSYPLMIKPADSDASRGVHKVYSNDDIEVYFQDSLQYSKCGEVIIESFIKGQEYVVEAFTKNNHTENLIVGHRDYFQIRDTFIPCATVFVDANSATSDLERRLKAINRKLVEGFGLPFGITHAEYLYDESADKIYLVEIAARGGGVFISSELIPAACGVNANDLLVKEVLGLDYDSNFSLKKGAAAYYCFLTPEGVVTKVEGTELVDSIHGVRKLFFDNIKVGMKTQSIKDKSSRKGPILVEGKTKSDCYQIIEKVKAVLKIEVDNKGEKKSAIWR